MAMTMRTARLWRVLVVKKALCNLLLLRFWMISWVIFGLTGPLVNLFDFFRLLKQIKGSTSIQCQVFGSPNCSVAGRLPRALGRAPPMAAGRCDSIAVPSMVPGVLAKASH